MTNKLQGEIWLAATDSVPVALNHIKLLRAIAESGSISAAARVLGISYKTAWERMERLNNLSSQALVESSVGGSQGGGCALTPHGQRVLSGYLELNQEHSAFIEKLGEKLQHFDDLSKFVKSNQLITSAGNQFLGTVLAIQDGAVNAEVILSVSEGFQLVAIITEQSLQELGLQVHAPAVALIKASSVLLSKDTNIAVSARNKITGKIARIEHGKVNADVFIDLGNGKTLNAVVTEYSLKQLNLQLDEEVCAFFKASSVILLVL